jgi:hypothetical protein
MCLEHKYWCVRNTEILMCLEHIDTNVFGTEILMCLEHIDTNVLGTQILMCGTQKYWCVWKNLLSPSSALNTEVTDSPEGLFIIRSTWLRNPSSLSVIQNTVSISFLYLTKYTIWDCATFGHVLCRAWHTHIVTIKHFNLKTFGCNCQ